MTIKTKAENWWRNMAMEGRVKITVDWKFKTKSLYKVTPFLSIDMRPDIIERIYREEVLKEDLS